MANIKITDLTTASALSGTELLELVQSSANRKATVADLATRAGLRGHIFGLTLSNNGTDATNDIDIAAGEAASDASSAVLMVLAATLTKRLDAAWAVGSGNGGLDTGSIANTTYHVWLIQRSDTGVVDALFSTSASAPTMPTSYDRKRRIGSIIRASGAIRLFRQYGDVFKYASPVVDRSSTSGIATALLTISTPLGIKVSAINLWALSLNGSTYAIHYGRDADSSGTDVTTQSAYNSNAAAFDTDETITTSFVTNTSAQIFYGLQVVIGTLAASSISTLGWIDTRGRDA